MKTIKCTDTWTREHASKMSKLQYVHTYRPHLCLSVEHYTLYERYEHEGKEDTTNHDTETAPFPHNRAVWDMREEQYYILTH